MATGGTNRSSRRSIPVMPSGQRDELAISPDPRKWRPLEPRVTRRPPQINDPILEPLWSGTRVLAHFRARPDVEAPGSLELLDADGVDVTDAAPQAVETLGNAIMAFEAVIDGILTRQATAGGEGSALIPRAEVSRFGLLLPRQADMVYDRPTDDRQPGETAFVAFDLLSVDDQPLLSLPLLERKRQLESLFVQSELVRVSPHARPPLGPWLNTWKSAGFRGVMMKAANSRYRPGDLTIEWTTVERLQEAR
jgi:ATP-dependent DNA ligase